MLVSVARISETRWKCAAGRSRIVGDGLDRVHTPAMVRRHGDVNGRVSEATIMVTMPRRLRQAWGKGRLANSCAASIEQQHPLKAFTEGFGE